VREQEPAAKAENGRRRLHRGSASPAWHGESYTAWSPMPIGPWRASGDSV